MNERFDMIYLLGLDMGQAFRMPLRDSAAILIQEKQQKQL